MDTLSHALWAYLVKKPDKGLPYFVAGSVWPDVPYLLGGLVIAIRERSFPGTENVIFNPHIDLLAKMSHSFLVLGAFYALLHAHRLAVAFAGGWLFHLVLDLVTHAQDGLPPLWPILRQPVLAPLSYHQPLFYGRLFAVVNGALLFYLLYGRWRDRYRKRGRILP